MSEQVFWLSGSPHMRKLTLDKIKGQFANDEIIVFSDVSLNEFEETVYQENCFIDKRLLILNSFPSSNSTRATVVNALKKTIESLPSNCYLVFNNLDGEGVKPLTTQIAKIGKVFEYDVTIQKDNAHFWVMKTVEEAGKSINEEAARLFVETNGYDPENKGIGLDVLKVGIDKLLQYVGKRKKTIEQQDVVINSFPSNEFVIWSIFDAMDTKDIVKCSQAFRALVDNSDSVMSAVIQLLNISLWRYRLLIFAKETLAKNMSKADTAKELGLLIKVQTEGSGFATIVNGEKDQNGQFKPSYTSYTINKELNGSYNQPPTVDKYNRKELVRIVQCLSECIAEMRLRPNEASLLLLADTLMYTICDSANDEQLNKIRRSLEV